MGEAIDPTMLAMAAAMMHEEGKFELAGDVVQLPHIPRETAGPTDKSSAYATGKTKDESVKPIPLGTLNDWMQRTMSRRH